MGKETPTFEVMSSIEGSPILMVPITKGFTLYNGNFHLKKVLDFSIVVDKSGIHLTNEASEIKVHINFARARFSLYFNKH